MYEWNACVYPLDMGDGSTFELVRPFIKIVKNIISTPSPHNDNNKYCFIMLLALAHLLTRLLAINLNLIFQ